MCVADQRKDPTVTTLTRSFDLSTQKGVFEYVEQILIPDVRTIFAARESVAPYGMALNTMKDGAQFIRPIPESVGVFGHTPRAVKNQLRKVARLGMATGAIFIRQAEFPVRGEEIGRTQDAVVIQLEHREFGDVAWTAIVLAGKLGEFTRTQISLSMVEIKESAYLKERYMS